MTRSLAICICACWSSSWAADQAPGDLLRFRNGDQLHGTFVGIKEGPLVVWQRPDLELPAEFKPTDLRHVILRSGRALKPLSALSYVGLVNGDRLPALIRAMDRDSITLETSYAGVIKIPRQQVTVMAIHPLGGRVYYYGPYAASDWTMTHAGFPDGMPEVPLPPAKAGNAKKGDPAQPAASLPPAGAGNAKREDPLVPGRWEFSGAAWHWNRQRAGTALIRKEGMPDHSLLSFELAWKNRLSLAIGFHADFARGPNDPGKGKVRRDVTSGAADLPRVFGNSYVLQLYTNYLMLYRTSLLADGNSSLEQVQPPTNLPALRLAEAGRAKIELRSNRSTGKISLYLNDEFIIQWDEPPATAPNRGGFAGKGNGFGFLVQGDDSPLQISDIILAEWNGMPDSARSMQLDDQDVVLMNNGVDRYGGEVQQLDAQGRIAFRGKHGSFEIPIEDIAEIRLARKRQAAPPAESREEVVLRMAPIGSISGTPMTADHARLTMNHALLGNLNIALESVTMLEFDSSKHFTDDWNEGF